MIGSGIRAGTCGVLLIHLARTPRWEVEICRERGPGCVVGIVSMHSRPPNRSSVARIEMATPESGHPRRDLWSSPPWTTSHAARNSTGGAALLWLRRRQRESLRPLPSRRGQAKMTESLGPVFVPFCGVACRSCGSGQKKRSSFWLLLYVDVFIAGVIAYKFFLGPVEPTRLR